ncbi:MAG: TlpA family protein disulfide reductase [Ardenticatenaceae bacterium]|nr:TlpA family protein disulfide reductase [Ardenticatenaceae bacterium]MCB9446597.1 TlpA family protein disulfide reductase [Ardenticatenaceae bacterium]
MSSMHHARKKQQQKQRSQRFTFVGIALFIVGVMLLLWMALQSGGSQPVASAPEVPEQGKSAPNFTSPVLSGGEVALADYSGDVVIVNFWATWCPPCKAEMPGINAFYERHQEEGLVVLAVNAKESESLVRPFIEASGFTFPVLLDPAGSVVNQYQIRSFPTTLIIDRDGVVRHIQVGMISEQELESIVAPLL